MRDIINEKICRIDVLETKLALFECASEDNMKLDAIANDWEAASTRMRELESENENLHRQLDVQRTANTKKISKLRPRLRKNK